MSEKKKKLTLAEMKKKGWKKVLVFPGRFALMEKEGQTTVLDLHKGIVLMQIKGKIVMNEI
ncbi:MAG TPA: hypothetical protein VJ900_02490 [Patescibacteria group bacterium]|nr:hypothetical protein [Patescibacteria group bacterium]